MNSIFSHSSFRLRCFISFRSHGYCHFPHLLQHWNHRRSMFCTLCQRRFKCKERRKICCTIKSTVIFVSNIFYDRSFKSRKTEPLWTWRKFLWKISESVWSALALVENWRTKNRQKDLHWKYILQSFKSRITSYCNVEKISMKNQSISLINSKRLDTHDLEYISPLRWQLVRGP